MKHKLTLMKLLTGGSVLFFLAAVVVSFGVCLTGCDGNVSSIEDIDSQDEVSFFDLPYDPVELAKKPGVSIEESVTYTAVISAAEGGVILLDEPDDFESLDAIDRLDGVTQTSETLDAFVIQPNSISGDVSFVFEVTRFVTVDGDMPVVFDCNPDGLVFIKPAFLLINAWNNFGKKTEIVNFYHYNETTQKWELLEQQAPDSQGLVAFNVYHFSRFGVGGDPQSGKKQDIQ